MKAGSCLDIVRYVAAQLDKLMATLSKDMASKSTIKKQCFFFTEMYPMQTKPVKKNLKKFYKKFHVKRKINQLMFHKMFVARHKSLFSANFVKFHLTIELECLLQLVLCCRCIYLTRLFKLQWAQLCALEKTPSNPALNCNLPVRVMTSQKVC